MAQLYKVAGEVPEELVFHSLPVQTTFDGTTDVHENFTSAMKRDPDDGLWRATLRGRALLGEEVQLPEGYLVAMTSITATANVPCSIPSTSAHPSTSAPPDTQVDELEVSDQVLLQTCAPRYVVWEHDKAPARAASISQWITLAQLIHTSSV
ncbi:hypothetical protein JKF63_07543 [Porcisia hertigi]|uniref:Uncharacterized protein n=1 Tax=Porcisia hertigi TaxID=2761500 RepID=A0A836IUL9_9TRYP|nr:hypothetical protein JKF63_07543 [Porcisia hertigi]